MNVTADHGVFERACVKVRGTPSGLLGGLCLNDAILIPTIIPLQLIWLSVASIASIASRLQGQTSHTVSLLKSNTKAEILK